MDSGNSGSLQSSSGGGDDDFDAACGGGGAAVDGSSSPLSALLRHPPSPSSSVPGFGGASSLIYGLQDLGAPPLSHHWCSSAAAASLAPGGAAGASPPPPSLPCRGGSGLVVATPAAAEHPAPAPPAEPAAPAAQAPRGPSRKRARASRRAPTTVLTTDTSNFRAMVQEFTGIPAPPFAGGATPARSRFDHYVFPSRSPSSAAAAALPQYLLRPFAPHKLHASSTYPPPSTSAPAPPPSVAIAPSTTTAPGTAVPSGDSYHQLTTAAPSALLGMQDHGGTGSYLSFQSTLATHVDGGGDAKYPMFDRGGAAPPSAAPRLQDAPDFLGLAHGIVRSEGTHLSLHQRNGDELSGLVGGAGGAPMAGLGGCKATYSSAPPLLERNGRGPPAGVVATATTTAPPVAATAAMRTHGVDSWVCSTSE